MKISHRTIYADEILWTSFCSPMERQSIMAAVSARDITKNMVRVKSSNLWSYTINQRDSQNNVGDMYVQFKGRNGGPGELYVYYDVPMKIYQKFLSAPSKGHALWQYIKGKFTFAKLTGDKRTKQRGGVNSR